MNTLIRTFLILLVACQFSEARNIFTMEEGISCPDSIIVNAIAQAPVYQTFQEFLDAGGSHSISSPVDSTFKLLSETSDGNFCPGHKYREYGIMDEQGIAYNCTQVVKVLGYKVDLSIDFVVNDLTVEATSSASDGTIGYEWDFGDGFLSNDANVNHTYENPGIYTICCSAATICDFQNVCQEVNVGIENFTMTDISTYYYCNDDYNIDYTFKQYLQFGGSTTSSADTASFEFLSAGDTIYVSTQNGCTLQVPQEYTMKDTFGQIDTAMITVNLIDTVGIQGSDIDVVLTCDADTIPRFETIEEYKEAGGSISMHCYSSVMPMITFLSEEILNEDCPRQIARKYEISACSKDTITHMIEYIDTVPPTIFIEDITVQYKEDVPTLPATLDDFIDQGGKASDNCALNVNSFTVQEKEEGGNPYVITRSYFIEDQCGGKSSVVQMITVSDPTSVDDVDFDTYFSVYPNPGHSNLTIQHEGTGSFEVSVYSADGKRVFVKTSTKSYVQVDTRSWEPGVFVVQVITSGQKFIKKWIKK